MGMTLLETEASKLSLASQALVMVDATDLTIVYTTHRLEHLFGYDIVVGELIGKPLSILIPPDVRERHDQYVKEFAANPVNRTMGKNLNLRGVKKDGTEFKVAVLLSGCMVRGDLVLVANVVEVVESV